MEIVRVRRYFMVQGVFSRSRSPAVLTLLRVGVMAAAPTPPTCSIILSWVSFSRLDLSASSPCPLDKMVRKQKRVILPFPGNYCERTRSRPRGHLGSPMCSVRDLGHMTERYELLFTKGTDMPHTCHMHCVHWLSLLNQKNPDVWLLFLLLYG